MADTEKTSTGGSSATGKRSGSGRLDVYEHIAVFFVRHTWKAFFGCWGILILLAVLAVVLKYLRIDQIGFDDWLVLGTQAVDSLDKYNGAQDAVDDSKNKEIPERNEDAGQFFQTNMIFKWADAAEQRDFLTPRNLQDVCLLEGATLNHPSYALFCRASTHGANGTNTICDAQRLSVSATFYSNEAKRNSCELVTEADISSVQTPLYALLSTPDESLSEAQIAYKATIRFMVGPSFDQTGKSTTLRSILFLGGPLFGYKSLVDASRDPQFALYQSFLLDVEATMFKILGLSNRMFNPAYNQPPDGFAPFVREPKEDATLTRWFNFALEDNQFGVLVNDDQLLAAASVIIVGVLMYIHMKSMWFTSLGLLSILLSVPASAFFYSGVFGIKYFTQIHIVIIFIIIGIGTDDVFVFVDAWKQAAANWRSVRNVQSGEEAAAKKLLRDWECD
jgi:hypothetical protein